MKNNVKLINGEALDVLEKLIKEGVRVDAIITDIPYGTTACSWDNIIPIREMWALLDKIVKDDNTPIILFGQEPFSSSLIMSNVDNFKYKWYYKKRIASNFASAKHQPMKHIEDVIVFTKNGKKANYYPIMQERAESGKLRLNTPYHTSSETNNETMGNMPRNNADKTYNKDYKFPENIQEFNNRAKGARGSHPTQKPIELMEYLVKSHTNENDTVLDFTMGSGTTGIACVRNNRKFIGIELEKKYFDIAQKRIKSELVDPPTEQFSIFDDTKQER